MQESFFGKTWIYRTQFVVEGMFGLFSVVLGTLFWTGAMADANGQARPQAGPPMVTIGSGLLILALLALVNILGRRVPLIRCYRECIEINLVGATMLDGVPLLPGWVRLAWAVISLQGFRSERVIILWANFEGAVVGGVPMDYRLELKGRGLNLSRGREPQGIWFKQVALRDHPQMVAQAINDFASDEAGREKLAKWDKVLPKAVGVSASR